jgi:hypothetical protein
LEELCRRRLTDALCDDLRPELVGVVDPLAAALSHLAFLLLITYLTVGLGFNRFNGLGSR